MTDLVSFWLTVVFTVGGITWVLQLFKDLLGGGR